MKRLALIILSLLPLLTLGQTELHSRKKKAIEEYLEARSLLVLGQNAEATPLLVSAIRRDKSFDEAIMSLMQVYLNTNQKTLALNLYSNSKEEVEQPFQARLTYDLAKFLWSEGNYELAKQFADQISPPIYNTRQNDLALLVASIDFALKAKMPEQNILFEDLLPKMNLFDMQYFPSLDASGQLIFTARDKRWGGDEQIMRVRDSAGVWGMPQPIAERINSSKNEGTAAISADGKTLVFTGCNRKNNIGGCDLYVSYKENGEWPEPTLLPKTVNTPYWESQPSLSSNGQTLYFVSTQPGMGGQDIWVSQKVNGRWTTADPLNEINTMKDDASPFIYPDDKTLFFATNGRPGLGRFDLFKSVKTNSGWLTPENLGKPINNEQDQLGYSISVDGWAYFSSTLTSGKIIMRRFKFPEFLLPELSLIEQQVVLVDAKTKERIDGQISIEWEDKVQLMSPSALGVFAEVLQSRPERIIAKAKGYVEKVVVDPMDSIQIELNPLPLNELLSEPIFYASNEWRLGQVHYPELDRLSKRLREHPEWRVSVEGYADTLGKTEDNLLLSQRRVDQVVQYLIKKGVSPDQLEPVYFGETKSKQEAYLPNKQSDRKVLIRLNEVSEN